MTSSIHRADPYFYVCCEASAEPDFILSHIKKTSIIGYKFDVDRVMGYRVAQGGAVPLRHPIPPKKSPASERNGACGSF
jgi:hypothetical protein